MSSARSLSCGDHEGKNVQTVVQIVAECLLF